jgi:diguanylate cyclase (GGDEF)-like protein/PAS domain S-box-containing protein
LERVVSSEGHEKLDISESTADHRPGRPPDGDTVSLWIADVSPDLITLVDSDGVFAYLSPACRSLFGWDPDRLVGRREEEFVHPADLARLHAGRAELAGSGTATSNFRLLCADGSVRWTETVSRQVDVDGSTWIASAVRDTSGARSDGSPLELHGLLDPLTGAANRTLLMDRLQRAIQRVARDGRFVAVMYLDLDRFKAVNDSMGHQVGDAVLVAVASRLIGRVRPSETVARLGGDEFVIVAEGLPGEREALELAERFLQVGREPFQVDGRDFLCTVSLGVVCTADPERRAVDLIHEADMALYRAKERGRDRVEYYDEELRSRADARQAEESALRQVLAEGTIRVEYEPIVDLRSRRVVAAQAVPYIRHHDRDVVLSPDFLDDAERWGLLAGMNDTLLREGLGGARCWEGAVAESDLPEIAVHVTARHLASAAFCDLVTAHLDDSSLPHRRLLIEVTERTLLEASETAMNTLKTLRDGGVQIGLDGFGTGYSSVAHLGRFPLDFIKIAPSLVHRIERTERDQAVVSAIVSLAHAFRLTVVARGVETEEELQTLETLECDRAQGPAVASAAPADVVHHLVTAERSK